MTYNPENTVIFSINLFAPSLFIQFLLVINKIEPLKNIFFTAFFHTPAYHFVTYWSENMTFKKLQKIPSVTSSCSSHCDYITSFFPKKRRVNAYWNWTFTKWFEKTSLRPSNHPWPPWITPMTTRATERHNEEICTTKIQQLEFTWDHIIP